MVKKNKQINIKKIIQEVLKETVNKKINKFIPDAVYIVFDGTSYYGVFGCDIEDEINTNDVEIVKGPFREWNDDVDYKIEMLNNEI